MLCDLELESDNTWVWMPGCRHLLSLSICTDPSCHKANVLIVIVARAINNYSHPTPKEDVISILYVSLPLDGNIFEGQMKAVAWPCLKIPQERKEIENQFGNSETDLSKLCKLFSEHPRHVEEMQRRWGKATSSPAPPRSLLG